MPAKRVLPLADQLRTSIQQLPPAARTYSRKETGFVGACRVGVAGGSTFFDCEAVVVPRFGTCSSGLPDFQAAMTKTTSAAIPVSANAIQRRSSRRCCRCDVRRASRHHRLTRLVPSAPKRELNSST